MKWLAYETLAWLALLLVIGFAGLLPQLARVHRIREQNDRLQQVVEQDRALLARLVPAEVVAAQQREREQIASWLCDGEERLKRLSRNVLSAFGGAQLSVVSEGAWESSGAASPEPQLLVLRKEYLVEGSFPAMIEAIASIESQSPRSTVSEAALQRIEQGGSRVRARLVMNALQHAPISGSGSS